MLTTENKTEDMEEKLTDHGDSSCTEDEFLLSQPTEEGEETQSTVEGKEAETSKATSRTRPPYEIFPWLKEIHRAVRTNLKCEYSQRNLLIVMDMCIKHLKDEIPSYLRLPNKSLILSKHITRLLILFKYLNRNFDDSTEYLLRMSELLGFYTQLELKYSTKFEESRQLVANRICLHYDLLLQGAQESYILRIFLQVKNCFNQKEVMRKIYEKYLRKQRVLKGELPDKLFVMYLVAYKLWKNLEDDKEEQLKIDDYANNFMQPKPSLRTNPNFAPFIPSYKAKTEDATRCILSEHFNTNSLIQAIKKDDIIDNAEKSLGNIVDLSICDELPLAGCLKSENENQNSILLSKTIKLEKPEVIATIDLTAEEKIRAREICWLESLRRKARAAEPIHIPNRCSTTQQSNIIAVIDLDDDEDDDEVRDVEMIDETNLEAKDLSDVNLVSTNLENSSNISENEKNCENVMLPGSPAAKKSIPTNNDDNRMVDNGSLLKKVDNEALLKETITQKSDVSDSPESGKFLEDSNNKVAVQEFGASEVLEENKSLENCENDLSTNKIVHLLEANENVSTNNDVSPQVETVVSQKVALSDCSVQRDETEDITGAKINSLSKSNSTEVIAEEHEEDRQTEIEKQHFENTLQHISTENLTESVDKIPNLAEKASLSADDNEFVSVNSDVVGINVASTDNIQEKFKSLCTEEINKEVDIEATINCSPLLEVPQLKEQCSSVTKSKEGNDQILNANDLHKGDEAYDSTKLFDDDDFFKDFTENLATKNPMCKTYQRKKKSAVPNIPVLTIPPVKDSTMLDLPAFSPPSSSECNDDSRDSNSLSILEESEPIDDDNFELLLGKPAEIDDTPIEKISPSKVNVPSSKPTSVSNVVFSMSSNRKISLPPPKEELLPPISSMSSNVVFSTGKQFSAKIDLASSNIRRDSILDDWNEHREELFEENTNSTSTSLLEIDNDEIASPTMEQFTNSDVVDVAQFFGKVSIPPKNIKETTQSEEKVETEENIPSQNLNEEMKTTISKTDRITSILNSNAKSRTEFRDTCSSSPLPSISKKKSVSFVDSPQRKASGSIIYPKESIILEKKTYIKPFSINATEPLDSWESSINTQSTSPSSNQHDAAEKSSCSPRITVRSAWPTANTSPNFEDTVVWSPSSRAKRWHVGKSQVSLYKKANLNNTFKNKLKYMDGPPKLYTHSFQTEKLLKNINYKVVEGVKIKMNDFEEKLFHCVVMIKRADEIAFHPTEVKTKRVEKANSDFDKYLKKKSIEAAKKIKFQYSPRKSRENKKATNSFIPKRKYVKRSFQEKYITENFHEEHNNSISIYRHNTQTSSPIIFGMKINESSYKSDFNLLSDEKLRKRVEVQLRNIALMKEYRKYFKESAEKKQSQSPTYCRKARSLCDMKNVSNSAAVFKNDTETSHFAKKEVGRNGSKVPEIGKITARRRSDSDTICNYDRNSSASKVYIQVFKKAAENEKSTKARVEEIPFQSRDQHFLSQSPFELPEKLLCDDVTPEKLGGTCPNISLETGESSKYFDRNKTGHINLRETLPTDDECIHRRSETLSGDELLEKNSGYDPDACYSLFPNSPRERKDARDCGDYESFLLTSKFSSSSPSTAVGAGFLVGNIPLCSQNYIEPRAIKSSGEDQRKQNSEQITIQQNQTTTNCSERGGNANINATVGNSNSGASESLSTNNSGYMSNDNEVSSTTQQIGRVRTRRKTVASGWSEIASVDVALAPTQKKRKINELETEISGSVRDNAPTTTTTIVKPSRRRRKSKALKNKVKQLDLSHTDTETDEHACSPVLVDQQRLTEINIPFNARKGSDEEKHIGASELVTNPYSMQSINPEVNRKLSESPEDLNVNANIRQTYSKNSFIQNVFVPPDVEKIIELSQNNMRQQNEEVKEKKSKSGKSRRKREFNY